MELLIIPKSPIMHQRQNPQTFEQGHSNIIPILRQRFLRHLFPVLFRSQSFRRHIHCRHTRWQAMSEAVDNTMTTVQDSSEVNLF